MTIRIFGDSLSTAHGLDCDSLGWPNLLARSFDTDCINYAKSAADNLYIYHCYLYQLPHIRPDDIVIIGWTHPSRKSFVFDHNNRGQVESLPKSFIYETTDTKFIRSRNPQLDTLNKWSDLRPTARGNAYYDLWFDQYYSEKEQQINLTAYFNAVKSTCPGLYIPFFFSTQSVQNLPLTAAGHAVDFIAHNDCAISREDSHFSAIGHQLWAKHLYQYISQQTKSIFPVIELVDRLAIAEVKWERTQTNQEELTWYQNQMRYFDLSKIKSMMEDLKQIHRDIWDKEALLKSGKEHSLSMDEIGRRAIAIRDCNNKRVSLKNSMAQTLSCAVRDIKKNHLSE